MKDLRWCYEGEPGMGNGERINPKEAHERVKAGIALLVCAYDDDEKFKTMPLEGAISLSNFQSKLPSLSKNHEIMFYCT